MTEFYFSSIGQNMTLAPLINSPMPIPHHAIAAVLATAVGAAQLWLTKGTSLHRTLGYVWAGLIVFVAITGFFIFETGVAAPFDYLSKPLSVLVLVMLWWGVRLARAGKIKQHRQTMTQLFWLTMLIGLLTIQPGRIVHQMLTGV
jgi:uncharacterized membrane protein